MARKFEVVLLILFMGLTCLVSPANVIFGVENRNEIININQISKNSIYSLSVDEKTGNMAVVNNENGFKWSSNPETKDIDNLATGLQKISLQSQFLISYCNSNTIIQTANSKTSCLDKGGFKYSIDKESFNCVYDFVDLGIKIPVIYKIINNYLEVSIDFKNIIDGGINYLVDVTLLPYFGATEQSEKGYMLVPDGSGAIINLNSKKNVEPYMQYIYLQDPIRYQTLNRSSYKNVCLPVFGIKRENNAMIAIIEKGAAISRINAAIATDKQKLNNINITFNYRTIDSAVLQEMSWNKRIVPVLSKNLSNLDKYVIRYNFISGDKANLAGMAEINRKFIVETQDATKKKSSGRSSFINILSTIPSKESFLGIPYTSLRVLSSFSQISEMIIYLRNAGFSDISISIDGAMKGGPYGKINNKIDFESKIGGEIGYKKLSVIAQQNNAKLYPTVNINRIYKSGNGISATWDGVKNVSLQLFRQYEYYSNTFDKAITKTSWNYLNPIKMLNLSDKLSKNINVEYLSIENIANEIYSDFNKNKTLNNQYIDRANAEEYFIESVSKIALKTKGLYFNGGNQYVVGYSDILGNIPLSSSEFEITDEDVPYYQMVVHGLTDYAGESANLCGDPMMQILKSIEYGAVINYTFITSEANLVKGTNADYIFSGNYKTWSNMASNIEIRISDFYKNVAGKSIVDHYEVAEGLFKTVYGNGAISYVNYNINDITVGDIVVKGKDFELYEGDDQ